MLLFSSTEEAIVGLKRGLKCFLLLERTWVRVPAPAWRVSVNSVRRNLTTFSGLLWHRTHLVYLDMEAKYSDTFQENRTNVIMLNNRILLPDGFEIQVLVGRDPLWSPKEWTNVPCVSAASGGPGDPWLMVTWLGPLLCIPPSFLLRLCCKNACPFVW